ncbi:MAG: AMP-binding protein, partial [Phyllobacterium sp.]|uniref:AMP-binding protein n=1 Tax=Phyllobacterium sp. TaxID=1871046 RepID=UPI0030F342EB
MTSRYKDVYREWQADPLAFWAHAAIAIDWFKPWNKVFDAEQGPYGRWYAGAECNTCHNAVDRHVEQGRADQVALIYDSAVTGMQRKITYAELLDEVNTLAAVLTDKGVDKGDRVIIYMAMVPEAIIAMLACARIGAVHSVVFGGFAAHELATRIDDAKPVMIVATSCGLEPGRVVPYKPMLDKAIEQAAHKVETCLILVRPQQLYELVAGRDFDYAEAVAAARGRTVPCAVVKATDPLYILYTSGTTGQPKGVVRDNGGHLVALAWSM